MTNEHSPLLITEAKYCKADDVLSLDALLKNFPFKPTLTLRLATESKKLRDSTLSNADILAYLGSTPVKEARDIIELNHTLFSNNIIRLCLNEPHYFSTFQKMGLVLASLVLSVSTIFSREFYLLWHVAKKLLMDTGNGFIKFCAPNDTSQEVVSTCLSLMDGEGAVFNLNNGKDALVSYQGPLEDIFQGPTPGLSLRTVSSWIDPIAFEQGFVCYSKYNFTTFLGHSFMGSLEKGEAIAQNGFPILSSSVQLTGNPILDFIELTLAYMGFNVNYCIAAALGTFSSFTRDSMTGFNMLAENAWQQFLNLLPLANLNSIQCLPGTTLNKTDIKTKLFNYVNDAKPLGYTQGFEVWSERFEKNIDYFTVVYVGITLIALTTAFLITAKKLCEKWDHVNQKRAMLNKIVGLFQPVEDSETVSNSRDSTMNIQ